MDSLSARFAAVMQAGVAADSVGAMNLAEEHRRGITRWFYDCPVDLHRGLGDMYVNDHRFTENIDATVPGLAAYMRDAINANADRQEQAEM
jgi:hypothetical protein